jgi:hypothetical protein
MSCRMCILGCSNSQNHTWLALSLGKWCCTLWRWYGKKPSWCKIHHTICAIPVVLEILCILVIGLCCTAARGPSSACHYCSHSTFTHGKVPVPLSIPCMFLNVLRYGILRSGYSCWYLLQKSYHFCCRNNIWVKQPGHEADHSPPAGAEVKKMWIYTSTPPYAFVV